MRLLFVADGRSPIALNWIRHFADRGHEVHLVSPFACEPGLPLASLHVVGVAFSRLKTGEAASRAGKSSKGGLWGASLVGLRTTARQWFGPLTLPKAAQSLQTVLGRVQPELVHAMRIPYEGMIAAIAAPKAPLVVSVWGNDFTLHAPATPLMARSTRLALEGASVIHADCERDLRLAHAWGFPEGRQGIVLPGGGGVQMDVFYPSLDAGEGSLGLSPTIINPRGIRAYVRNDAFFRSIPLVLEHYPQARFVCTGMAGEPQAERWLHELGIAANVDLLSRQPRTQMARLFRQAQVTVSPTTHDGTPNTLLEAMACGCFPVAGDLESLREWITPGVNGLLVDPGDAQALAEAILLALHREDLRRDAARQNVDLVKARAEHTWVMDQAEALYHNLIRNFS